MLIAIILSSSALPLTSQNVLIPYREGLNWGFKSYTTQEVVIAPKYKTVNPFFNGRAVFQKGKKFGYLDHQGNQVIRAKYKQANNFSCTGLAEVQQGKKSFSINVKGEQPKAIPIDCGVNMSIHHGSIFALNNKYGVIADFKATDTILYPIYDEIILLDYYQQPKQWNFVARKELYWGIVLHGDTVRI